MIRQTRGRMRLCCVLLAANLLFIWGNSLMPGEISSALSHWVGELLDAILPGDGIAGQGDGLLRKAAHFCEFSTLGLLLSWLLAMTLKKPWGFPVPSAVLGFLTACADELLQFISADRQPRILDVGVDMAGVLLGIALLSAGHAICKIKNNHKRSGGK